MTPKDLKGKRVTVVGLGLHGGGVGTVRFLARHGARVLVTDIKQRAELLPSIEQLRGVRAAYVLGQHRPEDFIDTDLIVRNPGVPLTFKYFTDARANGVKITSDVALFFNLCASPVAAVTGTKGKSTTASLLYAMLKRSRPTVLAGTAGVSALSVLDEIKPKTTVVLELSSWQLEDLAGEPAARPHVAIITNITEDHLDRHGSQEAYIEAKKNIFIRQKKSDTLILNYDDPPVQKLGAQAPGAVYYFSARHDLSKVIAEASRYQVGAFTANGAVRCGRTSEELLPIARIPLLGSHNLMNVLAAVTAARVLGVPPKLIAKAVSGFQPLRHRLEVAAEVNGVKYVNDTTATNPTALAAGLAAIGTMPTGPLRQSASEASRQAPGKRTVVLIAGGTDKGFTMLAPALEAIERTCKAVVLLGGEMSARIAGALEENKKVPCLTASSMVEAVTLAAQQAAAGDTVLLSPGASSFHMFTNEFDRGDQFVDAVKKLVS